MIKLILVFQSWQFQFLLVQNIDEYQGFIHRLDKGDSIIPKYE